MALVDLGGSQNKTSRHEHESFVGKELSGGEDRLRVVGMQGIHTHVKLFF